MSEATIEQLRVGGTGGAEGHIYPTRFWQIRRRRRQRRTLFGKQAKGSKRGKNSMSWILLKLIWGVHMHLLYHVQCTKTVFRAWYGCRSSESTSKSTRSGLFYLMKLAYCSKSLLTSQIRQNFNSSGS